MRLIFALPDYLRGHDLPRYHACIEWFNPFHAPNSHSKFYSITRSHRNNAPVTEIMPLASIVSSCYLTRALYTPPPTPCRLLGLVRAELGLVQVVRVEFFWQFLAVSPANFSKLGPSLVLANVLGLGIPS